MKSGIALLLVVLGVTISPVVIAQPPDHFELMQNVPDPFCPTDVGGVTDIRLMLPMQSRVLLKVWNPDTSAVLRTLADGVLAAGYYSFIWDGQDGGGQDLPAGAYPYSMAATDEDNGDSLFYDVLVATIDCSVASRPATWGAIKSGIKTE